jgi:hypothetical protein
MSVQLRDAIDMALNSYKASLVAVPIVCAAVGAQAIAYVGVSEEIFRASDTSVAVGARIEKKTVPAGQPETVQITVRNFGSPMKKFDLSVTPRGNAQPWTYTHTKVSSSCTVSNNGGMDTLDCGYLPTGTKKFWLSGVETQVGPPAAYIVNAQGHQQTRRALLFKVSGATSGGSAAFIGSALS